MNCRRNAARGTKCKGKRRLIPLLTILFWPVSLFAAPLGEDQIYETFTGRIIHYARDLGRRDGRGTVPGFIWIFFRPDSSLIAKCEWQDTSGRRHICPGEPGRSSKEFKGWTSGVWSVVNDRLCWTSLGAKHVGETCLEVTPADGDRYRLRQITPGAKVYAEGEIVVLDATDVKCLGKVRPAACSKPKDR